MAPKGKPKKSSKSKQQAGYKKDSAKAGASTRHSEKITRDICYVYEIILEILNYCSFKRMYSLHFLEYIFLILNQIYSEFMDLYIISVDVW